MRRVVVLAFVGLVITGSARVDADDVWFAAITSPSSPVRTLLRSEAVQKELQIEAEQWPKIQQVLDQWQMVLPDLDALSAEERDRKIDELLDRADLSISTEDALARALTPAQQTRLKQLLLQQRGTTVIALKHIGERLALTDEQKVKISDVQKAYRALPLGQAVRKREDEEKELLAVLTPEQLVVWDKLIGPKFDVQSALRSPGRRSLQLPSPSLVIYAEVQKELAVSEEQHRRLRIVWGKMRTEAPAFKWPRSAEEEKAAVAERDRNRRLLSVIAERAQARVLSPEQLQRWQQLELQRRGTWALGDKAIADQLGLGDEQRQKIADIGRSEEAPPARAYPFQLTEAERRKIWDREEELKAQLAAVLTPEQRSAWEKMLGPKFDLGFLRERLGVAVLQRE